MLSTFAPHIAEEMWEKLGNSGLVSKSVWPSVDNEQIHPESLQTEELLKSLMGDIANILKVTKMSPKKIIIYTASELKVKAYHQILSKVKSGETNVGAMIKALIENKETEEIKKNPDFVKKTINDILSEPMELRKMESFNEENIIQRELESLVSKDFGVDLKVYSESDPEKYDPKNRAKNARPFKPAILIE